MADETVDMTAGAGDLVDMTERPASAPTVDMTAA